MIRTIVVSLVTLMLIAGNSTLADAPSEFPETVRFVILGDRTGSPVPGVYEQIVEEALRLRPEFLFTVGDAIVGYTEDSTTLNERWTEYLAIIDDIPCPIYATPGNNDIGGVTSEQLYRRYIGNPYYSFDHGAIHFIVLDNSRWERSDALPAEQIEWLTNDLNDHAEAAVTFVFMHKPFWYNSTYQGQPDTLHSLFVAYGVDAVVTGHFHNYFSDEIDGILYTSVGSSGGGMNPNRPGPGYHFVWVTVDADGIIMAPVKINSVLPWDVVTADVQFMASHLEMEVFAFTTPATLDERLQLINPRATLRISNLTDNSVWSDSLHWQTPPSWTVQPSTAAVNLAPGESDEYSFEITHSGAIYPLPAVTFRAPYTAADSFQFDFDLGIARQLICRRASSPPVIDGALSESFWDNPTTDLFYSDGTPADGDSTFFYFGYDDDNLYLGAKCNESKMEALVTAITEMDGPVHTDDCAGFMIQPNLNERIAYQVYTNSMGIVYDQRIFAKEDGYFIADNGWDATLEVATSSDGQAWTVEMRIPLEVIGATAKSGDQWGVNFRRKQQRTSSALHFQRPWSYNTATYGRLVLE